MPALPSTASLREAAQQDLGHQAISGSILASGGIVSPSLSTLPIGLRAELAKAGWVNGLLVWGLPRKYVSALGLSNMQRLKTIHPFILPASQPTTRAQVCACIYEETSDPRSSGYSWSSALTSLGVRGEGSASLWPSWWEPGRKGNPVLHWAQMLVPMELCWEIKTAFIPVLIFLCPQVPRQVSSRWTSEPISLGYCPQGLSKPLPDRSQ